MNGLTTPQLALIISMAGLACTIFGLALKFHTDLAKLQQKVEDSCKDLDKIGPIKEDLDRLIGAFRQIDPLIAQVLHKPHPSHVMSDRLIEKWEVGQLNGKDRAQLRKHAEKVLHDKADKYDRESKAEAAAAALLIMKLDMEDSHAL